MLLSITKTDELFVRVPVDQMGASTLSRYSTVFGVGPEFACVVNSVTNAIDVVDRSSGEALQLGHYGNLSPREVERLRARGHFAPWHVREAIRDFRPAHSQYTGLPSALVTICPTYSCNFACAYCYERDLRRDGDEPTFPYETVEKFLLKYFSEYRHAHNDNCYLGLFGGEPLQPSYRHTFEWAARLCRREGWRLAVTTNGFGIVDFLDLLLLNRDILARVCTTLDGPPDVHDRRRRLRTGQLGDSNAHRILKGIDACLLLGVPVRLDMNLDKSNAKSLADLIKCLQSRGLFSGSRFEFSASRVDDQKITGRMDGLLLSEVDALRAVRRAELVLGELPSAFLISFLKTLLYVARAFGLHYNQNEIGRDTFKYCWAVSDLLQGCYVDCYGDVYRCTYTVGDRRFRIGNLSTSVDFGAWKEALFTTPAPTDCELCPLVGYCSGGCRVSRELSPTKSCVRERNLLAQFFVEFEDDIGRAIRRRAVL